MTDHRNNPVARAFGPMARLGAVLGGWCLVALSALVGLEVVLRRFFNLSLQGVDEFGGYAVAVVAAFGFANALLDRAHTRIEIFTEALPGPVRAVLNLLALLSMAGFATFMAWRGWTTLMESIEYRSLSGTPLMTPLWMPQAVWIAGLVFFAIVAVGAAVHAAALLALDWRRVNRYYGTRSLDEELAEETRSVALRRAREAAP